MLLSTGIKVRLGSRSQHGSSTKTIRQDSSFIKKLKKQVSAISCHYKAPKTKLLRKTFMMSLKCFTLKTKSSIQSWKPRCNRSCCDQIWKRSIYFFSKDQKQKRSWSFKWNKISSNSPLVVAEARAYLNSLEMVSWEGSWIF